MSWKKTWLFFAWQSVRYARDRAHFRQIWSCKQRWGDSFKEGRNSVTDELPWITFLAIDALKKELRPDFMVFEFGGGGSTLFFCKNVAEVVTVEDHPEWFKTLTETVKAKGYQNWRGFFVQPETTAHPKPGDGSDPASFKSKVRGLEHLSFEQYARTIDQFPVASFDLILVDGRARPSCIQQAIPRLKTGGLLVVDNTERPYYLAPFQAVLAKDFSVVEHRFSPGAYVADFTRTSIFRKK